MSNIGKTSQNKKRFEAFKGATGVYNINIFSSGVSISLMSEPANIVKKKLYYLKICLIDKVNVRQTTNVWATKM